MLTSSARLLALLGLMQSRRRWSGPELAGRLGVSDRTVRKDIDRLRSLGYPVDAARGPGGHYELGVGAALPPLLLDEDEAVAVAVGLRAASGVTGIEETSVRALAKLEAVLPHHLRRQVAAVHDAVVKGPENTSSNVRDPQVDAGLLQELAAAIRDRVEVRFDDHAGTGRPADAPPDPRQVEPYRLVSWQRRWYLVARDARTGTWAPYRVDWIELKSPGGRRFSPVPFPEQDFGSFVLREVAATGWAVHARVRVDAAAEEVLSRINPTVGVVEPVDDGHCVLVTGGDSVEVVAVWIGMLGLDFHVDGPAALVEALRVQARRYAAAVPGAPRPR
ncbi:helix-turn-helix transcriptional regulator [Nakamurella sp.]|uniref:helix-turn-helix transcriptional regulator n=1 Tax=Nakamurella sp. TaxID=1869182 RepID=UPI003B3ACDDD